MKRRDCMKFLGATALGAMLPFGTNAFAALGIHSVPKLPIPPLLKADTAGRIQLKIQTGETLWRNTPTKTWGVNGSLLGPALMLQQGQKVTMEVTNALQERTALHWHGLEIPGVSDGGPQAFIEPGATWKPELKIAQRAATCWFHPHPHGVTGRHVAMGIGGLVLIEDDETKKLPLPNRWGIDDIPVVLQDKRLDANNQIDYKLDMISAAVGWFGDMMLTNGALYPEHTALRGWVRLRLLNGCNARALRLACSDNRPMYVIASDGGLLSAPVKVTELTMYTGERFEVLVDMNDQKPFDLLAMPVKQMGMMLPPFDVPVPVLRLTASTTDGRKKLPDALSNTLPAMPKLDGLVTRKLQLSMDPYLDAQGMQQLMDRYGHQAMSGIDMSGHGMPAGNGHAGMAMAPAGAAHSSMSGPMPGMTNGSSAQGMTNSSAGMNHAGMRGMAAMNGTMMGSGMMHPGAMNGSGMSGMMHSEATNATMEAMHEAMGSNGTMGRMNGTMGSMNGTMGGMMGGAMMDHGAMSGSMEHGAANATTMAEGHAMPDPAASFDLLHSNFINGKAFTMGTPSFDVKRGQYERWIISGVGDMMLHPFHIHGTQFRILTENGHVPEAHRQGMKDTVFVEGKESEVLVHFQHEAPAERMFMAHCHILEHEDTGMMLSFTVSP